LLGGWVEVAQFHACVVGGEVPVDLALVAVGVLLPGGEFGVEHGEVVDAAVQALAGEGGELDLGDVEPGPVFWGCGGSPGRPSLIQDHHSVIITTVHNLPGQNT
jgi:hypothetical protein